MSTALPAPKRPSARVIAITLMRTAGYENDGRERVRLLVESRVNRAEMNRAWSDGELLREIADASAEVAS